MHRYFLPTLSVFFCLSFAACSGPSAPLQHDSDASNSNSVASFQVVDQLAPDIWHMHQDSQGHYWFGSHESGLFRWRGPGSRFDHFTTASGLRNNGISQIQEDRDGRIYARTGEDIHRFDGRGFTHLKLDMSLPVLTEWKLGADDLWFHFGGDDPHAVFYDGQALRRLRVPKTADGDAFEARLPRSLYPNRLYSPYDGYTVYRDSRGNVWFGTASLGACRLDGTNFAWISEADLNFAEKDNRTFGTRSIFEDREGKFWITVTRSRYEMYPDPTQSAPRTLGGLPFLKEAGLPHPTPGADEDYTFIISAVLDHTGDLWMATLGSGVWRYDGTKLTNYPVLVDGQPIGVFSIYRDRKDQLWLGTLEHGVCRFNGTAFEKVRF